MNINSDIFLDDEGIQSSSEILMEDKDNNQTIVLRSKDSAADIGGEILLRGGVGAPVTLEIDGNWASTGMSRIRTHELEIIGGMDIAEHFEIKAVPDVAAPQSGMLVSMNPLKPGELQISTVEYDNNVAGIISGANNIRTGMYLGQSGDLADSEFPIALLGRVYVLADASFGAIKTGDLLTSSPVPDYAMKVKNHRRARGAVVGKAMSAPESDKGYVLV